MSFGISAAAIASAAVSVGSAYMQSQAAGDAADASASADQASIAEQRRQYDQLQKLLNPYVQAGSGSFNGQGYLDANPDLAGNPYWSQHPEEHWIQYGRQEGRANPGGTVGALVGQQDLLGLNGNGNQQTAINGIQNSASFKAQLAQGENSIRQNASATGGLRGGNIQAALAQYSPQLLAQQIQQQYSNLGGLTKIGQSSAAGVGNAGMDSANQISALNSSIGSAQSGNALAQGTAYANGLNGIAGSFGFQRGSRPAF